MSSVYCTDRDLGNQFPGILKSAGLNVEQHKDHFAPDARDEDWLRTVGSRGWIALTHDRRIRYKPNERDAVMRNGVALLVLVGKAKHSELADGFIATLPKIEQFVETHSPPYIAKVYRPSPPKAKGKETGYGSIKLWFP